MATQEKTSPDYGVGAILACSWGYDQTNVDFYEVVRRTPKSVVLRRIASVIVERVHGADRVVPRPGEFTHPPMTRRVNLEYGESGAVRISDGRQYASPWDGKPKYQTASGFGH